MATPSRNAPQNFGKPPEQRRQGWKREEPKQEDGDNNLHALYLVPARRQKEQAPREI